MGTGLMLRKWEGQIKLFKIAQRIGIIEVSMGDWHGIFWEEGFIATSGTDIANTC